MSLSRVESQYLVGSGSPLGHSINSVSSSCCGAPHRCEAPCTRATRAQLFVLPSRQGRVPSRRQTERALLHAQARPSEPSLVTSTHHDRRYDRYEYVFKPQGTDAGAERGVGPVARVREHCPLRYSRGDGFTDLLQRDLWFGLERDLSRETFLQRRFAVPMKK